MHSQQPPGVVQNWSTLQCSKQNTRHRERERGRHREREQNRSALQCSKAMKTTLRSIAGTAHLFCFVDEGSNPGGDRDPPNIPKPPL